MQHVIEQATQALQLGRFEAAKTLVSAALEETESPTTRLALLEVLVQAQTGLQEYAAASHSWQDAYKQAATPDDKARLFEQARQAIRDQQRLSRLIASGPGTSPPYPYTPRTCRVPLGSG